MSATECFQRVRTQLEASAARSARSVPRLVAVSKFKSAALVREVYDLRQRHFGENYVQELLEKAPQLPGDIAWHFIGQLQSNKAAMLVSRLPNLWAVESVDSIKLARKLDAAAGAMSGLRSEPLRVFVQVNTSGEEQKGGAGTVAETIDICTSIIRECQHLHLQGLMTIGKLDEVSSVFFERLVSAREQVTAALAPLAADAALAPRLPSGPLELSMGMSGDFGLAIEHGSTNVRIGSSIFGAR